MASEMRKQNRQSSVYPRLRLFIAVICGLGALLIVGTLFFGRLPEHYYRTYAMLFLSFVLCFCLFFCVGIFVSIKAIITRAPGSTRILKLFLVGIIAGFIILLTISFSILHYYELYSRANLERCEKNLRTIGEVLERYGATGALPQSGEELKRILPSPLPTCPSAGMDTYTSGYESDSLHNRFTVHCSGSHHRLLQVPAGYPQYSPGRGIIRAP